MFSHNEQEEIINNFLRVININDNRKLVKANIETCKTCKINLPNTYLFKTFPTEIAKSICQYSFHECEGCKNVKKILEYKNENKIILERLITAIREREELNIEPYPFEDDGKKHKYLWKNEIRYYFSRLNPYPTYKKILNKILTNKNQKAIYTQKIHKELKKCYENNWQIDVKIARGEGLDINHPIHFWKIKNTDKNLRNIINQIMDYIEKNKDTKEILKLFRVDTNYVNNQLKHNRMTSDFTTKFPKQICFCDF